MNTLHEHLLPLATKHNMSPMSSIALSWLLHFPPNSLGSMFVVIDASAPNEHGVLQQYEKESQ